MASHTRIAFGLGLALASTALCAEPIPWVTVTNNGVNAPGTIQAFNSYSQSSVNAQGLVVFQGRTAGATVIRGIYARDMGGGSPVMKITAAGEGVPPPNNLAARFNSFPSLPRIDVTSPQIAFRGQSQPVYRYLLADGTETRVGTSGIYATPTATLITGASLLGAVVESGTASFPYFAVPGAPPLTRFDQFPGSPSVDGQSVIAFKGNWTDPATQLGRTGVYYRDLLASGGTAPTLLVADSTMPIPGQPAGGTTPFGSTAPPSTANGYMYFVGLDIEEAPTLGGIYRAKMVQPAVLEPQVLIGAQVPGEPLGTGFAAIGQGFALNSDGSYSTLGEGLSVNSDGRYVSFWAAWGTETFNRTLICPSDGQQDLIAACLAAYPNGYTVAIPVHQGIFVHDADTGTTTPVSKTTFDGVSDYLYWVYSGAPPTVGESPELPRWRSSAFHALSGAPGSTFYQVAFKAHRNGVDGIFMRPASNRFVAPTRVARLLDAAAPLDPQAPAGAWITAVGIERDGFRQGKLTITAGMLYEDTLTSLGWAGIYYATVTPLTTTPTVPRDLDRSLTSELVWTNAVTGRKTVWLMSGLGFSGFANLDDDPALRVALQGDFDGNAKGDLVWRNQTTGETSLWLMDGGSATAKASLRSDPQWVATHAADFDGDDNADLLWHNAALGATELWLMRGTSIRSQATLLANQPWKVEKLVDLDGNGYADLIWRHPATGETAAWLMSGASYVGVASLLADPQWAVAHVGDFNGDGRSDLVWQNATTGETALWLMNGTTYVSGAIVLKSPDWRVAAVADFDGDGKSDLLWRNPATGEVIAWLMDGTTFTSWGLLLASTAWDVIQVGDYDGNGKSDIVFRNATTGESAIWLMNGVALASGAIVMTNPDWSPN